ncbi:MAG: hypothetical protein K8R21_09940, partial [Leptospira sp.]|nr:hypothetical protein [Leptospira sp.]
MKSARTKELRQPKGMAIELEELRNKLSNFLITRKKETGLITENKTFKLTKNASRLFRMEGTEKSGRKYSLVISTGNYLTEKDGVVNGLINLEEAELN